MFDDIPTSAGVWTVVAMVLSIVATIVAHKVKSGKQRKEELDAFKDEFKAATGGDDRQRVLDAMRRADRLRD